MARKWTASDGKPHWIASGCDVDGAAACRYAQLWRVVLSFSRGPHQYPFVDPVVRDSDHGHAADAAEALHPTNCNSVLGYIDQGVSPTISLRALTA